MSTQPFKQYIGDSVYANFDGYAVELTTENGLPSDPSNIIILDSNTIKGFKAYLAWLEKEITARSNTIP